MLKYNIFSNGNKITISNSILGKETVFYNDELKSAKTTFGGTTHTFTATENGEQVTYETKFGFGKWYLKVTVEVKRNGETIFANF